MQMLQNRHMKKAVLFAVFMLSLVFAVFLQTKKDAPQLSLPGEFNLGNVELESKKYFEIKLTNPTQTILNIAKVYTSCGCTRPLETSEFLLKPNEEKSVKFEFDPSSMHQKEDLINHEIYFLTDEKEYTVKILGKVI